MANLPQSCEIVVIGGGIAGCSAAYHLAQLGHRDVVVLERNALTSGATWHAAGMVGQLRSSANMTELLRYSVALYDRLEAETGLATGWKRNGSLRLASTRDRRAEYERQLTMARSFGLEIEMLTPAEVGALCPGMNVTDLDCGVYVASDGVASPTDLTMSLARGAKAGGARIFENIEVTGIDVVDGTVTGVHTKSGHMKCEKLLIAAGIWSRNIGQMAGVNIPLQPAHHQYMVSERIDGIAPTMPSIRDPDSLTYYKEEVGGLVAGGYEFNPMPYMPNPADVGEFKLFEEETDHFSQFVPAHLSRFPGLGEAGVKQWFNGLESFTEDTNFILGEAPEVRNVFVSCGYNAMGIAAGGGAGMAIAHWISTGSEPFDLWPVNISRFSRFHRSDRIMRTRALEGQAHHYAMHWPNYEFTAARPLRRSAVYDRLKARGACFGGKAGWERPNWFAPAGVTPEDVYTWDKPNWFAHVADEHRTVRSAVGLFDQSSFSKAMVVGADAEAFLQRVCSGDVGKAPGRITYTQALNEKGGIECDLTVARIAADEFYVVTGTAMAQHDFTHLLRERKGAERVHVIDVTSAYGVLGVMGPQSRAVLAKLAESSLENADFPFGTVREVMIAGAPVKMLRMTFVGELGWELHVPSEYMLTVYDALQDAGAEFGLRDIGYRALDSLRLEKRFCVWGADIGPDYSPIEAGLGFAVAWSKNADFIGRAALMEQRDLLPKRRLISVAAEADCALFGRETIFRNGAQVGWLSSGGYGHTIGRPIGLGYVSNVDGVTREFVESGEYELEVAGLRVAARVNWDALYDPKSSRVRA